MLLSRPEKDNVLFPFQPASSTQLIYRSCISQTRKHFHAEISSHFESPNALTSAAFRGFDFSSLKVHLEVVIGFLIMKILFVGRDNKTFL